MNHHRMAVGLALLFVAFASPNVEAQPLMTAPPSPSTAAAGPLVDSGRAIEGNVSTPQWFDGVFTSQWGTNCIIIGSPYEEIMLQAQVGYWGTSDLSYPRVGERYWGRILVSVPGNACIDGITDAYLWIKLPADTAFAIDQSNPVRCYYSSASTGNQFVDVTNDPAVACPHAPSAPDGNGFYFMNARNLAQGMMFQIQFPLYSTKVKNGISDASSQLMAAVSSTDTPNTQSRPNNDPQYPYQWVWVSANPPTIDYPATPTTNITNTSATMTGWVFNHFTSGNAYFDFGTTTAYGTAIGPVAVADTYDAGEASVTWAPLLPGTMYHWRLRFVYAGGTVYGADRTFTTTGSTAKSDFNFDGKNDLLWRNNVDGQDVVWRMNGATRLGTLPLPTIADMNWKIVGTADFDGNRKPDIYWRNQSTGQNAVWLMNGQVRTGVVSLATVPDMTWQLGAVGDFNGDGKADIAWRRSSTGQNVIWLMNGATATSVVYPPTIADLNWGIVGAADFNLDGTEDLIWRNFANGGNAVWYMAHGARFSTAGLPGQVDLAWILGAAEDFSFDGKPDLVWRNTVTGANALWIMNGTSLSSLVGLPQITDQNWQFGGPR